MISFKATGSLGVERQLSLASGAVSSSFERLSSGLRINKASDDAAGLSVAMTLNNNARLYTTAIRNVNDGISALSIASNGIQSQSDIITRLKELAEQSANGTLSTVQRRTLNIEYQALANEFGRIGDTTSFNKSNLLLAGRTGKQSNLNIQSGIDGGNTMGLSLNLTDSGSLSGTLLATNGILGMPADDTHDTLDNLISQFGPAARFTLTDSLGKSRDVMVMISASTWGGTGTLGISAFIRADQSDGSVTSSSNEWLYVNSVAGNFNVSSGRVTTSTNVNLPLASFANGATASLALDIQGVVFGSSTATGNFNNIECSGVETVNESRNAMAVLTQRQNDLLSTLGIFGAYQSRLNAEANVLSNAGVNTREAHSRIVDVDVATESSSLVASSIRQQTASRLLSIVNQEPRLILDLLR